MFRAASHLTIRLVAGVSVAAILLTQTAHAGGRNRAIGIGLGVGAGLLLLNEVAKAAEAEKRSQQRNATPRRAPSDDQGDRPRRSVKSKVAPDDDGKKAEKVKQQFPDKPQPKPDQQVVDQPPAQTPRHDLPTFPDRPRDYIYALPNKPAPAGTGTASVLTPGGSITSRDMTMRVAAFSAGSVTAASMFATLFRGDAASGIPEASVRERAAAAYAADAELLQIVGRRTGGATLKEDRVQALIIAQAWRLLEADPIAATADQASRNARLDSIFQQAAADVVAHTQAASEAARLTRSGDNLLAAVNDVVARGGQTPELIDIAADRGQGLIRVLEAEVPAVASADRAGLASAFEVRRKLIDCVALRLPNVVEAAAVAPGNVPVERASADAGTNASAGQPGRGAIVGAIAADARAACAQLLAPARTSPVVPASETQPARKANFTTPEQPRLAGSIGE